MHAEMSTILCVIESSLIDLCEAIEEKQRIYLGEMYIVCLGHIPQIGTTAVIDCFQEKASECNLEDPAQDAAPCHSPSANFSSKTE